MPCKPSTMKITSFLSFLTSIQCSLLVSALGSSQISQTIASQHKPHNSTTLTSDITCTANRPGRWDVLPHQQYCAAVMRAFPSTPDIEMFHTGGNADIYQLPWFERHRDCEMIVEMINPQITLERSSWLEIGLAAMELNTACLDTEAKGVGGQTLTGNDDRIKITLRGYKRSAETA